MARPERGTRWLPALAGMLLLVGAGFGLGLAVGAVWEAPELVAGFFAGRSEEVELRVVAPAEPGEVAAAPPPVASLPEVLREPPALAEPAAPVDPGPAPAGLAPEPEPAAPEPVAAPAPVEAAPPRDGYSVQVGAFSAREHAAQLSEGLRAKGFPVYLVPGESAGDAAWRVRVGPFGSRGQASTIAGRLKTQERLPTWVLREEGS
jgi:cell division septation protein DedD